MAYMPMPLSISQSLIQEHNLEWLIFNPCHDARKTTLECKEA